MKLSLKWIKQYIDLPDTLSMERLAYDLTMRTVEVEGAENPAAALSGVVAGRILEVLPHPQADKLRVCKVDVGKNEPSTIVCGGSNLEKGMMVVVAVPGSRVRWHGEGEPVEIKPAKLRGVLSEGMICAASEIDMDALFPAKEDHEIMDITAFDAKPGDFIADVLGLDDVILEIDNKSMTNRPDLWGHYGIARELAAIYDLPLKPLPAFRKPDGLPKFPVRIENEERCMRYAGLEYSGISNVPSPFWLKLALWKCGLRAINAPVDLTNYVMLTVGQPTHGFDKNRIQKEIIVRDAREGEHLTLLDGTALTLSSSDLVIADAARPMALAGIMGGQDDSILPGTTDMLLEIATFSPTGIRRTSSKFQVHTDSSARNEKGLDTRRVDDAMAVADDIIRTLFPKAELKAYTDLCPRPTKKISIEVELDWLSRRLGRSLRPEEAERQLGKLGFNVENNGGVLSVHVPSWRATGDVSLPDDILEEIARMIGYENFDFIPPTVRLEAAVNQKDVTLERAMREYLAFRAGMQEIFTYPWTDKKYLAAAGYSPEGCLAIASPPSPETASLRPSLVPGMMAAIVQNIKYFDAFRVFEMAQVFERGESHPSEEEETLPLMRRSLCGALVGRDGRTLLREARGIVEMMPRVTMASPLRFEQKEKPAWADVKAWLNILSGDEIIGSVGLLSVKAMRLAGIKRVSAAVFEVNVEKVSPLASRTNGYERLPQFPLVEQDFSVLLDESVTWENLTALIEKSVNHVQFIEEYRGAQVPAGKKSLMFRVRFGSDEGTLSAEQIDEKMRGIMKKIVKKLGGEFRA